MKSHHVIVVPGLGGSSPLLEKTVKQWEQFGLTLHVLDLDWRGKELHFAPKLQRILSLIDSLNRNDPLSLVGISAGGSAVINAYMQRKNRIDKIVNICGRLRAGKNVSPSLELASVTSLAFKESVLLCEKNEKNVTNNYRKKMMTIRAIYDEVVPTTTSTFNGAKNVLVFSFFHLPTIALVLSLYRKYTIDFLLC